MLIIFLILTISGMGISSVAGVNCSQNLFGACAYCICTPGTSGGNITGNTATNTLVTNSMILNYYWATWGMYTYIYNSTILNAFINSSFVPVFLIYNSTILNLTMNQTGGNSTIYLSTIGNLTIYGNGNVNATGVKRLNLYGSMNILGSGFNCSVYAFGSCNLNASGTFNIVSGCCVYKSKCMSGNLLIMNTESISVSRSFSGSFLESESVTVSTSLSASFSNNVSRSLTVSDSLNMTKSMSRTASVSASLSTHRSGSKRISDSHTSLISKSIENVRSFSNSISTSLSGVLSASHDNLKSATLTRTASGEISVLHTREKSRSKMFYTISKTPKLTKNVWSKSYEFTRSGSTSKVSKSTNSKTVTVSSTAQKSHTLIVANQTIVEVMAVPQIAIQTSSLIAHVSSPTGASQSARIYAIASFISCDSNSADSPSYTDYPVQINGYSESALLLGGISLVSQIVVVICLLRNYHLMPYTKYVAPFVLGFCVPTVARDMMWVEGIMIKFAGVCALASCIPFTIACFCKSPYFIRARYEDRDLLIDTVPDDSAVRSWSYVDSGKWPMIGVFYSYIGMIRTQDSIWVRIASVVDVWSGIVFGIMNGTELAGALNIIGNCKLMLGISILLSVLQFLYLGIVRPYKLRFDQWSAFVRALLQMIASVLAISGQFASALNLIGVCMTAYMPVEFIVSQVLRYERKFTAKVPAMISENGGHAGMISTNLVTVVIPDHTSEELADCVKNVEFDLPEKTEIILIKERSVDELGDLL